MGKEHSITQTAAKKGHRGRKIECETERERERDMRRKPSSGALTSMQYPFP